MKNKDWYLATLTTLVIIVGSIIPLPNNLGGEELRGLVHFILYTICSFFWARSLKTKRRVFTLMVALIPLTEILQLPLPYRNSSLGDLMANTTGSIIGFLISESSK